MNLLAMVAIVRDEETAILKTLRSCENACDAFVVLDTGSKDRTIEFLHAWKSEDGSKSCLVDEQPWVDFAAARNQALRAQTLAAPAKWALSMSADETLVGGDKLRAFLESYDGPETALLVEVRTETEKFKYPRLLRTEAVGENGWQYVGAVHEVPKFLPDKPDKKVEATVVVPDCWIEHKATDPERRAARMKDMHLPALEGSLKSALTHGDRVRTMSLLAQTHEFLAVHNKDNIIEFARHQYAALGWYGLVSFDDRAPKEARTHARFKYLNVAEIIGVYTSQEMAARLAALCDEKDVDPAAHFMFAKHVAACSAHEGLQAAYKAARAIRDAIGEHGADPHGILWKTHLIAASCAAHLGHGPAAKKSAEAGISAGGPHEAFVSFVQGGRPS